METAVGVFDSRNRAEEAIKELIKQGVPQESIVFLTRSETDATAFSKEILTYAGGFAGATVGMAAGSVAAALALIPGIGQVFALGAGATVLLGLLGAKTGAALGKTTSEGAEPSTEAKGAMKPQEVAHLTDVLQTGRSLIVVRTESTPVAQAACGVLDRMGLGVAKSETQRVSEMAAPAAARTIQVTTREVGGITLLDLRGSIALGECCAKLRDIVRNLAEKGKTRIVLNLAGVDHVDSAGIGELLRTHTVLREQGGQMKLASPSGRVKGLFETAGLNKVFDIYNDEASAIQSFSGKVKPGAAGGSSG